MISGKRPLLDFMMVHHRFNSQEGIAYESIAGSLFINNPDLEISHACSCKFSINQYPPLGSLDANSICVS